MKVSSRKTINKRQTHFSDQKPSKQWQKANASEYFAEFGRDLWVEQKLSDLSDKEFDFLYRGWNGLILLILNIQFFSWS